MYIVPREWCLCCFRTVSCRNQEQENFERTAWLLSQEQQPSIGHFAKKSAFTDSFLLRIHFCYIFLPLKSMVQYLELKYRFQTGKIFGLCSNLAKGLE